MNASQQAATTIARGSKVKGSVTGSAPLKIEGELDGRVLLDGLVTVAEGGLLKGEVRAGTVQVSGQLVGNVTGRERVEVLAGGSLVGDVSSPRFVIIEGAFYKGNVEMGGTDSGAAEKRA
jgi:cytoskeletal protein CcmA (bactofilin family)